LAYGEAAFRILIGHMAQPGELPFESEELILAGTEDLVGKMRALSSAAAR
jgi:hypothetical protein